MTDEEFLELLAAGERPGVEFKNPRGRQDRSFVEVVRAILGMANRRNGGLVVIGVDDNGAGIGLTQQQLVSWTRADEVRQAVAPYADPYVYLDVESKTVEGGALQGRSFAILHVQEFEEVPVLCARAGRDANGNDVLQSGACYVRPSHMPATTNVAEQSQLRELLDLAIEKGVRKFLRRAQAAGLAIEAAVPQTDDQLFDAQRRRLDE
jgi:predicted HTH transcriptional regulator